MRGNNNRNYTRDIEPDLEEDKLLPLREKRGGHAVRAKALSHHGVNGSTRQNNVNTYVQQMNKLDFSFHSNLSKYSTRYKEYRDQETVFSKTIDVKPLRPMRETLSNFNDNSDFKSIPTTAVLERGESGLTQHQLVGVSSLKPVTVENKGAVTSSASGPGPLRVETRTEKRVKPVLLEAK